MENGKEVSDEKSKIIVGLILVIFAIYLNAQSNDKEYSYKNGGKILWVVDGVQLKDTVFY